MKLNSPSKRPFKRSSHVIPLQSKCCRRCVCVCEESISSSESLALNDGLISLLLWIICAYVCVSGPLSLSSHTLISSCHKLRIGDNPPYKGSSLASHLSQRLAVCWSAPLTSVTRIEIKWTQENFWQLGNLCQQKGSW